MADERPFIEPFNRSYKRLPEVERQIADALKLRPKALVERARQRDEKASDYLAAETLVHFIRRAILDNNIPTRDALFRALLERCNPHFRGKFRGFRPEDREDLQGEVMKMVVEDLFGQDGSGDFMQVRFWTYLERKCIDAYRVALRHTKNTESLDTGYSGDGVSEGRTQLEREADPQLSPEKLAMISEGLEQLPPKLLEVFLLRHYFGLKIGPDDPNEAKGDELSIAAQFDCSGRTIRNWLKEAKTRLAKFQEKHDGE